MAKVLVVYASDYQNTQKMAEAVAAGANSVNGCHAVVKMAEQAGTEDLALSDALVLGSPVHMGGPDWRVKKFIDRVCSQQWMKNLAVGKVGGVFVTGSGFGNSGGGAELTMLSMLNNIAELGMLIVPFPKTSPGYAESGLQWGPCARTADHQLNQIGLSENAIQAAHSHGANIARVAESIVGRKLLA